MCYWVIMYAWKRAKQPPILPPLPSNIVHWNSSFLKNIHSFIDSLIHLLSQLLRSEHCYKTGAVFVYLQWRDSNGDHFRAHRMAGGWHGRPRVVGKDISYSSIFLTHSPWIPTRMHEYNMHTNPILPVLTPNVTSTLTLQSEFFILVFLLCSLLWSSMALSQIIILYNICILICQYLPSWRITSMRTEDGEVIGFGHHYILCAMHSI